MSVYIKGMEMPKSCLECDLQNDYGWCPTKREIVDKYSYATCPLIHVPDHGRLIDADATEKLFRGMGAEVWADAAEIVAEAPTIIPADEEDGE